MCRKTDFYPSSMFKMLKINYFWFVNGQAVVNVLI